MDSITLGANEDCTEGGMIFELNSLYAYMKKVTDPRKPKGLRYAKSGEIAHINRSKPHSEEGENAGQRYCTSSVRHGPVSA